MTTSPTQTGLGKILATSQRWLWNAVSVLIPFITFVFLLGLAAVEFIPLGPGFRLLALIVPAISAIAVALIKIIPTFSARNRPGESRSHGTLRREIPALLSLLALSILVVAMIIPTTIGRFSRSQDAQMALKSFALEYDPDVDLNSLEQTLAEFERARRTLAQDWTIPPEKPPVSLEILRNIEAYRQTRDESWSIGFLRCEQDKVTIVVPVESDSGVLREYQHTGAPMHETTHAVMCQILGQEAFFSMGLWFHEGMAQLYQNKPASRIFDRAANRIMVWLNRNSLLQPEKFCDYQLEGSGTEIDIFYQTALEFARSLEATYGNHALSAIIEDVSNGATFDDSLEHRLGGVCMELYTEWKRSL